MKKETKTTSTIDQILENHAVSNKELVEAAKIYEEQRSKEKAESLVKIFVEIDKREYKIVDSLRYYRRKEKEVKDTLKSFNAAKVKFMTDGDIESFEKATGVRFNN